MVDEPGVADTAPCAPAEAPKKIVDANARAGIAMLRLIIRTLLVGGHCNVSPEGDRKNADSVWKNDDFLSTLELDPLRREKIALFGNGIDVF